MLTKRFYTVTEVSNELKIRASTLRYWEEVFPMFKPNRLPSGRRRFTQADVKMAARIRELVYDTGLKIDAAIELMNKTYRKSRPHGLRKCQTSQDAIVLLGEVKSITEDAHAIAKIEAVVKFLNTLRNNEEKAD